MLEKFCNERGAEVSRCEVWAKGGEGGIDLAEKVLKAIDNNKVEFDYFYDENLTIKEKIEKICKEIYGADGVVFAPATKKVFDTIAAEGLEKLPVCMSKTQKSISDNPALLGKPTGFKVTINDLRLAVGAGFVIAMAGDIIDMPGLPKKPSAEVIDIDENGIISGLF